MRTSAHLEGIPPGRDKLNGRRGDNGSVGLTVLATFSETTLLSLGAVEAAIAVSVSLILCLVVSSVLR